MSLINFLNPKLKPTAESDSVFEDGYSVANLISDDAALLARGFMAFSVTKPPVEIVFDFPKAIEVKVIKLWNGIAAMRSTAFEVYGKYEGIWERVASVRDLNKDIELVTFCYQSDFSSRSSVGQSGELEQSVRVFFYRSAHTILSNTNSLKVIIRATNKCPAVLRKAQVWGLPSRSLDKADRELVKTIWNEITNPFGQNPQEQNIGQRSPTRSIPELKDDSRLEIPEEFLDAITWDLMVFPTVLPSGKIVDQSTIDKHSEVESKWGRLPSDPFTGLEFSTQRRAVLNLALKGRIEKFLMENSEHFKAVPRSLGSSRVRRSKNRHASQFASLCQNHNSAAGTYSSLTSGHYKTKPSTSSATATLSSSALPVKRARLVEPTRTYLTEISHPTSTATQTSATVTASYSLTSSTTPSFNAELAIYQELQKIKRYTQPQAAVKSTNCIGCKSEHFSYEIRTCKHLVCRECLVKLTQEQLCVCKVAFCSADVERYHKL